MNSTIELVNFKLKSDQDESKLNDLAPLMNEFLKTQPGFYYRTLIKDTDGTFMDIVHWESEEKAKAASDKLMQQPWASELMAITDESSMNFRHIPAIAEIGYDG